MLVFINNLPLSLKKSSCHTPADIIMHSSSIIWAHLSGTFVPGALLHHKFFVTYCLSVSAVLTTSAFSQRTPSPYLPFLFLSSHTFCQTVQVFDYLWRAQDNAPSQVESLTKTIAVKINLIWEANNLNLEFWTLQDVKWRIIPLKFYSICIN